MNCQYIINTRDEIIFVNQEWDEFAKDNGASHLLGEKIIYQNIWKFITDLTCVYIYQEILKKVRAGHDFRFSIRCDSPNSRRYLEVSVILQENGKVLFENRLLRDEVRTAQKILDHEMLRSDELLIICSWCNRLKTGVDDWQEIDIAVKSLSLFEQDLYPTLSHGMCPDCYLVVSQTLDDAS